MHIELDDLSGPEITELLKEHVASMFVHTPAESVHALPIEGLRSPGHYFLECLGKRPAPRLRSIEGARPAAWRDQVDANRFCAPAQRRRARGVEHIIAEAKRRGVSALESGDRLYGCF